MLCTADSAASCLALTNQAPGFDVPSQQEAATETEGPQPTKGEMVSRVAFS